LEAVDSGGFLDVLAMVAGWCRADQVANGLVADALSAVEMPCCRAYLAKVLR
jgi:hypothetical protein